MGLVPFAVLVIFRMVGKLTSRKRITYIVSKFPRCHEVTFSDRLPPTRREVMIPSQKRAVLPEFSPCEEDFYIPVISNGERS
jgi:hypothetical protein